MTRSIESAEVVIRLDAKTQTAHICVAEGRQQARRARARARCSWGSDRAKFGEPEATYRGKWVCVTGKIKEYRGVPEVIAYEPSQIKIQSRGEE
jgi:DNA/RNA endonuclease YhcR with UshA esterase domain